MATRTAPGTGKIDPANGNLIGNWRDYGSTKAEVERMGTEWNDRAGVAHKDVVKALAVGDAHYYLQAVKAYSNCWEIRHELLLATAS